MGLTEISRAISGAPIPPQNELEALMRVIDRGDNKSLIDGWRARRLSEDLTDGEGDYQTLLSELNFIDPIFRIESPVFNL